MTERPTILEEIFRPEKGDVSFELARYILSLGVSSELQKRHTELAEKANEGTLNSEEQAELDEMVFADTFLSIMKSKARVALRKHSCAA